MYRLPVGRRVPPYPVAGVATETVAVELRRMIGAAFMVVGPTAAVKVDRAVGAGEEVSQDFSVFG